MPILELCAGYGGLGLAVEAITGDKVAFFAEKEEAPSKILAHRFPGVPNIGDITTFDWAELIGKIDIISAGSPCQGISNAGNRKGLEDERSALWFNVLDAVRTIRPRAFFFENVASLRTRGLSVVTEGLAGIGYDFFWTCLRASEVGGGHHRNRMFGIAVPNAEGIGWASWRTESAELEGAIRCTSGDGGQLPSDSYSKGLEVRGIEPSRDQCQATERGCSSAEDAHSSVGLERSPAAPREKEGGGHGPTLDDEVSFLLPYSNSLGRDGGTGELGESRRTEPEDGCDSPSEWWGDYLAAIRRWESLSGTPAPAPTELGPRGGRRLTARFAEWLMGLPDGWVTDVPGLSRSDQLKAIGNGVMPLQAFTAYSHLLDLMGGSHQTTDD